MNHKVYDILGQILLHIVYSQQPSFIGQVKFCYNEHVYKYELKM